MYKNIFKEQSRIFYLILFLTLIAVETVIAIFIHDAFIRPYLGDILVVAVIYCFVRIFVPKGIKLLPLYIFLFAACVEITQLFHLAELLHIKNRALRIIIGSTFDLSDIICYAVGCALLFLWEYAIKHPKARTVN